LVGNILGGWGFRCVQNKGVKPLLGPNKGQNKDFFCINLQKSFSIEPLARMPCYLAWSILGARSFRFVQIKSLGLCVAPPQGLKLLHSNI